MNRAERRGQKKNKAQGEMKPSMAPKQPLTRGSGGRIERGKVRRVSQEKGRGS